MKIFTYWKVYLSYQKLRKNPKDYKKWAKFFENLIKLEEVKSMLKGYKTYIIAVLMGALTVLKLLGYIDEATYDTLLKLLGVGAIGTVAAKINRLKNDINGKL